MLLVVAFFAGCGEGQRPEVPADDESAEAEPHDHSHDGHDHGEQTVKEGLPYKLDLSATSVYGVWLIYAVEGHNESLLARLGIDRVSAEGMEFDRVQVALPPGSDGEVSVLGQKIGATEIDITLGNANASYSIRGKLQDGIIWANAVIGHEYQPIRLVRSAPEVTVEQIIPENKVEILVEGIQDLSKRFADGGDWDKLKAFPVDYPTSPLIPRVYLNLIPRCGTLGKSRDEVRQLLDDCTRETSRWGDRFAGLTRANLLSMLAHTYYLPDLVDEEVAGLKTLFEGDEVSRQAVENALAMVDRFNVPSRKIQALAEAGEGDLATRLQELKEVEADFLADGWYLNRVGDVLASKGQVDEAIRYYGRAAALPMIETELLYRGDGFGVKLERPADKLEKLWTDKHGNADGLDAYHLEVYHDYLRSQAPAEPVPALKPSARPVLVELFTGVSAPTCVAAEAAFSVLAHHYADAPVMFLQYHLHFPGPNPMSNPGNEAVQFSLNSSGAPRAYLNRREVGNVSGFIAAVPGALGTLRREIEAELAQESEIELQLGVEAAGPDQWRCFATVDPGKPPQARRRLHLVLTEREVHYRGVNGVPVHAHVVRKILGPVEGTAPKPEGLAYEQVVDLTALRAELRKELEQLETTHKFKFDAIPLELTDLDLVAFVTDERTRRVLHSASVPVSRAASPDASVSD